MVESVTVGWGGPALLASAGCPDCPVARVVQASVLDGRFWPHLLVTLLPLVVLTAIVALIHRGAEKRADAKHDRGGEG